MFSGRSDTRLPTAEMMRAARHMLGLTQNEVCAMSGIGNRTLVAVESGTGSLSAQNAIVGCYAMRGISFFISADGKVQTVQLDLKTPQIAPGLAS